VAGLTRVLIVEDSPYDAELEQRLLARDGLEFEAVVVDTEAAFREALSVFEPDVVIADFTLPAFSGERALDITMAEHPEVPFIFMSGTIGEDTAVALVRRGAADYIVKDRSARLPSAVRRAIAEAETTRELASAEQQRREQQARADAAERAAIAELARSEERFRTLIQHSSDIVLVVGAGGRIAYSSPATTRVLGHEPDAVVGTSALDLVHAHDRARVAAFLDAALGEAGVAPATYRVRHADGRWRWIEAIASKPLGGDLAGSVVLNARDITERVEAERAVADQRQVLELIARGSPLDVVLDALVRQLQQGSVPGRAAALVDTGGARPLRAAVAPDLPERFRQGMQTLPRRAIPSAGAWRELARASGIDTTWAVPLRAASGVIGALVLCPAESRVASPADVERLEAAAELACLATERRRDEQELEYRTLHDDLTALPNRRLLFDHLEQALLEDDREATSTAVLFIDLDHFKRINDTYGHAVGDEVLRAFSQLLITSMRDTDRIYRYGGEEFLIFMNHVEVDQAESILDRVTCFESPHKNECFEDPVAFDIRSERLGRAAVRLQPDFVELKDTHRSHESSDLLLRRSSLP